MVWSLDDRPPFFTEAADVAGLQEEPDPILCFRGQDVLLVEVWLGGGVSAEGGEGLGAPPARPVLLYPGAQLPPGLPDVVAAAGATDGVGYIRARVLAHLVLVSGPRVFAPSIQTW